METRTMTELRTGLVDVLTRVQVTGEPVLITNYGRRVAVIAPAPDHIDGEGDR